MHSRVCTGVTRWACRRGARSAINSRLVRASMTACDPYAAEGVPSRSSEEKLFRFGILSDVQYAPIDDGKSHGGTPRFYRNSLKVLSQAVDYFGEKEVDFAVHLGDIVDGFNPKGSCGTGVAALDTVISEFDRLGRRHYHMLGNHCLYNCPRPMLNERLAIPEAPSGASYYSFTPFEGFRFVVLDCYDLSVLGWPEAHPKREEALAILRQRNPNENKNSPEGLQGLERRFVMFGGGVSAEQLDWLDEELGEAVKASENVVVFGHLPIHPGSAPAVCLLWNYEEVLRRLEAHPCVVLTLAGHTHADGYTLGSDGIHHRVLSAVLECPPGSVSYGHMDVFTNRIVLAGVDRMGSATFAFARSPSRTAQQGSSSDGGEGAAAGEGTGAAPSAEGSNAAVAGQGEGTAQQLARNGGPAAAANDDRAQRNSTAGAGGVGSSGSGGAAGEAERGERGMSSL